MSGQDITLKARDGGSFTGYLAKPPAGHGPGVVVIQEIFGVNAVMRGITDMLAGAGYMALCPDLFWRQEPGIQLTDKTDAEWARAFELFKGFNLDKGVADLDATIETLRKTPGCTGKVGTVGFCLGGRLAYLTATRTKTDAAVSYYGVYLTEHLNEVIRCPLMLHIAGGDEYVSPEAQKQIVAALGKNSKVTVHQYPGLGHAFARAGGKHWDADGARTANARTAAFFKKHIG
ncbi:MAG: dienelactone hydrolase family protein [Alphaproteobacteria bacterium]|nr:dienelactone hydrolase family protein [Alphaproteobacteria bacterium]